MAFLRQFTHDVFVSYAHVDNLPDRPGERGWVEDFADQLRVRLLKRAGEPVEVWRDPELRRVERFDEAIQKAVREAGVMIALISNRYLRSEYCADELAWFCEKASAEPHGLTVGGCLRVFPVLLYNFPHTEWPEACRGTLAFPFHDAEGTDAHGAPLDPAGEPFEQQMKALVEELHHVLELLREAPAEEDAPPFTVFLADTAGDAGPTRRRLARELEAQGVSVLTGVPPPHEAAAHEAAVRSAVERADLTVHLLTAAPGEPLDEQAPDRTYPLEQVRLALDAARSTLLLLPDAFDPADIAAPAYAAFFETLETMPREAQRLELIRTGRHQMLDAILAKRQRLDEAARQAALQVAGDGAAGATAFIDLHPGDVVHSADLVRYLAERQVVPMMIPSADLSPTVGMSLFEEHLRKAALFVVVYGAVAREWVVQRLNEAVKLILSQQLNTHVGVYLAPPRKQPDAIAFPRMFDVVDGMEHFETGTLDALLQKAAVG